MHQVDIIAALVAALAGFVIGSLWYGPMFQKPWMRHSGMTFEKGKQQRKLLVFGGAYVMNVVAAVGLSMLMADDAGWAIGIHTGLYTGLFFVAPALAVIHLFESRPLGLWTINAGYQVVNFSAMGAVVGAWPW